MRGNSGLRLIAAGMGVLSGHENESVSTLWKNHGRTELCAHMIVFLSMASVPLSLHYEYGLILLK